MLDFSEQGQAASRGSKICRPAACLWCSLAFFTRGIYKISSVIYWQKQTQNAMTSCSRRSSKVPYVFMSLCGRAFQVQGCITTWSWTCCFAAQIIVSPRIDLKSDYYQSVNNSARRKAFCFLFLCPPSLAKVQIQFFCHTLQHHQPPSLLSQLQDIFHGSHKLYLNFTRFRKKKKKDIDPLQDLICKGDLVTRSTAYVTVSNNAKQFGH